MGGEEVEAEDWEGVELGREQACDGGRMGEDFLDIGEVREWGFLE